MTTLRKAKTKPFYEPHMLRSRVVTIYLTPPEYERWQASSKTAGKRFPDFVRTAVDNACDDVERR